MRLKVGMLTIGQSPRRDIMEDLARVLSGNIEVVEAGALDDMDLSRVVEGLKPEPGHTIYVSRMRDGRQVVLSKEKLLPLIQRRIVYLEGQGVDVIVIMCSGEFPRFKCGVPMIYPDKLLKGLLEGLSVQGRVGVLVPLREQVEYARIKWGRLGESVVVESVSPYTCSEEELYSVGERLSREGVLLTVMDCVGYTFRHKRIVEEASGRPAITARGVVARALNELAW